MKWLFVKSKSALIKVVKSHKRLDITLLINIIIMKYKILIFIIIALISCNSYTNDVEILANTKCELIEIMMKESATNPKAQDLFDAKKKTYDSLYDHYKSKYTDSLSWEHFVEAVNELEKKCPSNITTSKTKSPTK